MQPECLAFVRQDPRAATEAFEDDPGHRRNAVEGLTGSRRVCPHDSRHCSQREHRRQQRHDESRPFHEYSLIDCDPFGIAEWFRARIARCVACFRHLNWRKNRSNRAENLHPRVTGRMNWVATENEAARVKAAPPLRCNGLRRETTNRYTGTTSPKNQEITAHEHE